MSTVFGRRKDAVSKSWSDMWEEDEEEEHEREMQARQALNGRTWSHESGGTEKKEEDKREGDATPHTIKGDVDDDLVADGFFFHDSEAVKKASPPTPRYSPPSKRFNFDKWAALGERRRGQSFKTHPEKSPVLKSGRQIGFGYKSYEAGVLDHSYHNINNTNKSWGRERVKECPWNKGRDWNWRRDRRSDLGDIEWVGGW